MFSKSKLKKAGAILVFFLCTANVFAAGFPVVSKGKLVAGLCPEPMAGPELEAAKILEKYLFLTTGDVPEIVEKGRRIVFKIEKGKMDIEGFSITFPSADKIVISGGSPSGLKYGTLEFCERFLGIRFLLCHTFLKESMQRTFLKLSPYILLLFFSSIKTVWVCTECCL